MASTEVGQAGVRFSDGTFRLRASATRAARPCRESLLELTLQTLGRDVMLCLDLHRNLDAHPRGLEANELNVVGHVLPVRMVIALVFFKRVFIPSLPMNQAHGLIIDQGTPKGTAWRTVARPGFTAALSDALAL